MPYDLIVIGAGPAGASAAARAAELGMKVLLLEKHKLPRHKTCGGGMPMSVGTLLPDLDTNPVEQRVTAMRHSLRFANPYEESVNRPEAPDAINLWMVQRSQFDQALANRAACKGSELREGAVVKAIEEHADEVTVKGDGWQETARFVVGADGATGVTAKAAGLNTSKALAIGMEVELPYNWKSNSADLNPEAIYLEYGAVPKGYAWIFPKAEHLNIGAGVFRPGEQRSGIGDELKATIRAYMRALSLEGEPQRYFAHPLPVYSGKAQLQSRSGRILLAGDAASLINPLFGDGILHAIRSGIIAAEAAAAGATQNYTSEIDREIGKPFRAASKLAKIFYGFPEIAYRYGITRPGATHTAARLFCGELPLDGAVAKAMRRFKAALAGKT